ncbi:hypothetical protein [Dongia sp. agr-C8]
MDSTVWAQLVRRYFQAAAALLDPANLKAGSFQRDQAAIKAAAAQDRPVEERATLLAEWLSYHRTGPASADHLARQVLPVLDRLDAAELSSAFDTLRAAVARDDKSRSFMVLTSRLLWARFPEAAPVYDSATVNGIAFLVKLLKAVQLETPYERIVEERRYDDHDGYVRWDFSDKKLVDHWYYKDFIQSHAALYTRCRPEIIHLIAEAGRAVSTASPFQVFDKILWLIGDHRHDYSLKGSEL